MSVRSSAEAEAALAGGATLIDVKEPRHGSLGRATATALAAIIKTVAGRVPVSAAQGELIDDPKSLLQPGLTFVKWGLAGLGTESGWHAAIDRQLMAARQMGCSLVPVAYADWRRAKAPSPRRIATYARSRTCPALLVDTWLKDGSTLLSWLAEDDLRDLAASAQVPLALAGSLGPNEISQLAPLRPGWFAVRGAACVGGRDGAIDADRVRALRELLRPTQLPHEVYR